MIISASRRTDIPAFYSEWFMDRIREGLVKVKNPFNPAQIRTVSLLPEDVDAIVFWTKNPANLIPHLRKLSEYHYYVHFSLTAYGKDLEKHVPAEIELIHTFRTISDMIGLKKVIWRYDPVILSETMDEHFHFDRFNRLASILRNHTLTCVFSFLEFYAKCRQNMKSFPIIVPDEDRKIKLAAGLAGIAGSYGISLLSCADKTDYTPFGILSSQCIDPYLISDLSGKNISQVKDTNQRKECRCVKSIDVGSYNTCKHGCVFCYANSGPKAEENFSDIIFHKSNRCNE